MAEPVFPLTASIIVDLQQDKFILRAENARLREALEYSRDMQRGNPDCEKHFIELRYEALKGKV